MKRKMRLFRMAAGVVMICFCFSNVQAYLTDDDGKDNVLLATENQVTVLEEFDPPSQIVPGTSFTKKPVVRNDSREDCYVRVRIAFSEEKAREVCEPLQTDPFWILREDGFWYYKEPLRYQECTTPVFSEVKFREDISKDEIDAVLPFELSVYVESVSCLGKTESEAWLVTEGRGG